MPDKMNLRIKIHLWAYYFLYLALAFLIPIHNRLASWVIAFIFLNWFLEMRYVTHFRSIFSSPDRWKLISFAGIYLLYLAGMLWSDNKEYGNFDLQVKLSLALFPIFFATADDAVTDPRRVNHYFLAFIAGCLTAALMCVVIAFQRYMISGDTADFFYSRFSVLMHTSYFAMYLNFAIILVLFYGYKHWHRLHWYARGGIIILLMFFQLVVVLLSSKSGILTLILTYLLIIFWVLMKRRFALVLYPSALLVVLFLLLFLSPSSVDRFRSSGKAVAGLNKVSRDASEATAARILIWRSSYQIIKDDPWTGAGTGDVKDQLLRKYSDEGISSALKHRLNAHNQYLQTWMTLGVAGLLMLVAMLVCPAISAFRSGNRLYLLFLILFAVNILTESMFETQSGVVFFAFFNALLFRSREQASS